MHNEQFYYLMHQDDVVALLSIDNISGSIVKVGKKVRKELLPPGGNLSANDLKKWWDRRAVPVKQGDIENILKNHSIPTTQQYLFRNLGLSLSDHYWINPIDYRLQWEDINLFYNSFKDDLEDICFNAISFSENRLMDLSNQTSFSPNASLQGELRKKWMIRNGERFLVKGNYGTSYQQSINEVIASLIHKKQNKMPYTSYHLCRIKVDDVIGIGCVCKDFSSLDTEFISGYDMMNSVRRRNDQSEYEHFIAVCSMNGLDEDAVRDFLEYQILSDFVITNTDRHYNNFGVLRDSRTLKIIGMAPIFDSGNSMFWNKSYLPYHNDLLNISVNSFRKKETDLLRYVKHTHLIDIDKLPTTEEVQTLLQWDIDFSHRGEGVLLGYKKKIELLDRFQKGEKNPRKM